MRTLRTLGWSLVVGLVASATLVAGLVATESPAESQTAAVCNRDGDQITWSQINQQVNVRGNTAAGSTWISTVPSAAGSYDLTAGDLAKADSFFIRYRVAGQVNEVQCPDATTPIGDGFCQQVGTELSWAQRDVSRNVFQVRRVNDNGSSSWVASVPASNPNTFTAPSATDSYIIRYRITSTPGNTTVVDEACTSDNTPPPLPLSCEIRLLGIVQFNSNFVLIDNAVPGQEYTLIVNGEPIESQSEPLDLEGITLEENVYFDLRHNGFTPLFVVDIAPSNDLTSTTSCGSIGEDRAPVSSCVASENFGKTMLSLSPEELLPFEVAVDGVITPVEEIGEFFPFGFVLFYYEVDALITSKITIIQDAGNVECTGDEANFCVQSGASIEWLQVNDRWNNEYNVRRINPNGSTSWVRTTSFQTSIDAGEGDFLVRYRTQDDAGNIVDVIDHVCVPE